LAVAVTEQLPVLPVVQLGAESVALAPEFGAANTTFMPLTPFP
jgi:hypothetical protein